jgi:penicillin-binding protein 1C
MQADASHVVADILADRAARAVAFGLSNPLETPFWSAVKTGTSRDMRDNWALGFSARYTVGVWVGNAGGSAMHDVSGVAGAAPIWRDVMLHLHRHASAAPPVRPSDLQVRDIRFEPAIEPPRTELFVAGTGQSVIRLAATHIAPRITTPANGAIIALDPDIPPRNQRVPLVASGAGGARWELDGKLLGNVGSVSGWFPQPGRHVLGLKGARGEVLDEARFEVRGAVVRSERGRQACPRDRQAPGTAGIPDCLPARAP